MRQSGIPTSSSPIDQRIIPAYEQYLYKVGTSNAVTSYRVVSHHPADKDHPCPHWHAAAPKEIINGKPSTFGNGAWKYQSGGPAVMHE